LVQPSELDALLARLAAGDRSAFSEAFQTLWPITFRLCQSLLRHEADAEDAAQQALEKIFARANDYDPARPALPWALAIASWECRTVRKQRQRRREQPEASPPERGFAEDLEVEHVNRDLCAAAVAAMGTLSPADREALTATFWEEAASVSGPALRKRRERALGRLRDAFRRLYGLD
jgi:RNA polymerase sigma-70 factor (ECF subfamily)